MLQSCLVRPPAREALPLGHFYCSTTATDHLGGQFSSACPDQTRCPRLSNKAVCDLIQREGHLTGRHDAWCLWRVKREAICFCERRPTTCQLPLPSKTAHLSSSASLASCQCVCAISCQGCTRSQFLDVHNQTLAALWVIARESRRRHGISVWVNPLSREYGVINGDSHLLPRSSDFSLTTGCGGGDKDISYLIHIFQSCATGQLNFSLQNNE